jgi:uncharacterized damage-inducible protein DinB
VPSFISSVANLRALWATERANTQRILACLPSGDAFSAKPNADVRAINRLAWHIVCTVAELPHTAGFAVADYFDHNAPPPPSPQAILRCYQELSEGLDGLMATWADELLHEPRAMYGETWAVGEAMLNLILHEVHHRGQLTILLRQAGCTVPGVYGPAQHEWAAMGMEPMP